MPPEMKYDSPTPILAKLLEQTDPAHEARRIFGLGHRSDFGPAPSERRTPFLTRRAAAGAALTEPDAVHDPSADLVAETTPAAQGPHTSTIVLPAGWQARLRSTLSARQKLQPLGPGAPTVALPPVEG